MQRPSSAMLVAADGASVIHIGSTPLGRIAEPIVVDGGMTIQGLGVT